MRQSITPSQRRQNRKVLHRPLEETGNEAPLKTENLVPMAQASSTKVTLDHMVRIQRSPHFRMDFGFKKWPQNGPNTGWAPTARSLRCGFCWRFSSFRVRDN